MRSRFYTSTTNVQGATTKLSGKQIRRTTITRRLNTAQRFFEPWRDEGVAKERGGLHLARLERKKIGSDEESNVNQELESKVNEKKANMAVADSLDRMRTHNAIREQLLDSKVYQRLRTRKEDAEDAELAREAFALKRKHEEENLELETREEEDKKAEEQKGTKSEANGWQTRGVWKNKRSKINLSDCLCRVHRNERN